MRGRVLVVLALVVLADWGCRGRSAGDRTVLTGFVEGEECIVRSEVAGRVLEVLVREGDAVAKGTLLVRIDARDTLSLRRQQELAIDLLKAKIERSEHALALVSTQVPEAIELARAELARAQADARLGQIDVGRERALVATNTRPKQELDNTEAKLSQAQAGVARQEAALNLARAREGEIRVAEATLKGLRAQLAIAEEKLHEIDLRLEKHEVRADCSGTVESRLINAGELAQPGKSLVSVLDEGDKYVRVYIPVPDLRFIHVHTKVEVEVDFLPGSMIPGEVEWIESQASFTPRVSVTQEDRSQQVYQARVRLASDAARAIQAGAEASVYVRPESASAPAGSS